MKDYYDTLGVEKSATSVEVKKAYRQMAIKYHPDKNLGDKESEEKFKEINEAYSCLSNPQKRSEYDQMNGSSNLFGNSGFGHSDFGFDLNPNAGFGRDFSEVFTNLFRNLNENRGASKGRDVQYNLTISFEEAVLGTKKEIRFSALGKCNSCSGTGSLGGQRKICTSCEGAGHTSTVQGFYKVRKKCTTCKGKGFILTNPCSICEGRGKRKQQKVILVNIPSGIESNTRVILRKEGEWDSNMLGDLHILVRVKDHPLFKRQGPNLFCTIPISFVVATLGGSIEIPTIDGKTVVKIPEGTISGSLFRLRGKGVRGMEAIVGDQLVRISIDIPKNLTTEKKELLKKFGEMKNGEFL